MSVLPGKARLEPAFWKRYTHMVVIRFLKYRPVPDLLLWCGLLFAFFLTRLPNLTLIPIFTDEAIYLRWSQIMAYDASLRYLPLIDGKQPLFMWLTSFVLRLTKADPLFAGRLTAVFSGLVGLSGVYFAALQVFRNKKIAYLAALLYVLTPFTLFYDRFTLADSLLAALCTWAVGLTVLLVRTRRLDVALLLGDVLGLGLLTKTPAQFARLYLPISLLTFNFRQPAVKTRLWQTLALMAIALVSSEIIYSILRLFPLFHMIAQKNLEFAVPLSEFLQQPFKYFGNADSLLRWEIGYLTIPLSLLALFSLLRLSTVKLSLLVLFLGHFLFMAFLNKVIYPRFLLTFTPLLLILAADGLSDLLARVKNSSLKCFVIILVLSQALLVDWQLLTRPASAAIPSADSNQYMNSWAAGYGVKDLIDFFHRQSTLNSKIILVTEGTFGLMPYSLELYQEKYPSLEIIPVWPLPETPPAKIVSASVKTPTYLLMYQNQNEPQGWHLKLVSAYQQGTSASHLRLYRVLP